MLLPVLLQHANQLQHAPRRVHRQQHVPVAPQRLHDRVEKIPVPHLLVHGRDERTRPGRDHQCRLVEDLLQRRPVEVPVLPVVDVHRVHEVLAVHVDAPHCPAHQVPRVEGRHGDRLALVLPLDLNGLGVLESLEAREARVDVVEREEVEVGDRLARKVLVVEVHLAHLVHGQRRVDVRLEAEVLHGVGQRAEVEDVRVRDEDVRDGRGDAGQVGDLAHVEEVVPPAVQQDAHVLANL
mmetsp:Transcript_14050/g.29493  ORF Transcript_14050/g.29493 Transcript_14050/m.29493 type:complete len:238 (-) Transcript_14050:89-802(-)